METGCDGRPLKRDPKDSDYSKCAILADGAFVCNTPLPQVPGVPAASAVQTDTMPGFFAQGTFLARYDPTRFDWISGAQTAVTPTPAATYSDSASW